MYHTMHASYTTHIRAGNPVSFLAGLFGLPNADSNLGGMMERWNLDNKATSFVLKECHYASPTYYSREFSHHSHIWCSATNIPCRIIGPSSLTNVQLILSLAARLESVYRQSEGQFAVLDPFLFHKLNIPYDMYVPRTVCGIAAEVTKHRYGYGQRLRVPVVVAWLVTSFGCSGRCRSRIIN